MSAAGILARQAERLCVLGRCREALAVLQDLAALEPQDATVACQVAMCLSGGCAKHTLVDPERAVPWFLAALAANPAGDTVGRARILSGLGNTWARCTKTSLCERAEAAVGCFREAGELYLSARRFGDWAREQYNLGVALCDLAGQRPNLWSQAVGAFRNALLIRTRHCDPLHHAATLQNLGTAYRSLPEGDRRANLRAALNCYRAALSVYRRERSRSGRAALHNNIGNVWMSLAAVSGESRPRLARYSLWHFDVALASRAPDEDPLHNSITQFNRAQALACLAREGEAAQAFGTAARGFEECGQTADARQARNLEEAAARRRGWP